MSYIVPSILVSQSLINAGGVTTSTPDLEACIIGPAYNNLYYVPGSLASQVETAVYSAVGTIGSISAGGFSLTVESTGGFNNGDTINVIGAGSSSGANLQAKITNISGPVITLDTAAVQTVSGAIVSKPGKITNSAVDNIFGVAGAVPGQVIDHTSLTVWVSDAQIETLTSGFSISPNSNLITVVSASTTGSIGAASSTLTVAANTDFEKGDVITVAGAGTAGATLTTAITNIVGTTITVSPAAVTSVTTQAVAKVIPTNLNSTTNTLRAEPGDTVQFIYLDNSAVGHVFTTQIQSVVTSSGLNGTVTNFTLVDSLPGSGVVTTQTVLVAVLKTYNDQLIPATNPLSGGSNLDITNLVAGNAITVKAAAALIYGSIISGNIYAAYKALRTDLSGTIMTFNNPDDLVSQLGDVTDNNPLGLACQIALANTVGRVRAIAIKSNDLAGHLDALTTAQGERVYFLVPLSQDMSVISAYKTHALQMSTPVNAAWRVALVNTPMPKTQSIGQYDATTPNSNSGNNATTLVSSSYVLTSSNATFIADGVQAGDTVVFTAATATPSQAGSHTVVSVISNQQLIVNTSATATAISYYVTRSLSKTQTATAVAATSSNLNTSKVVHVQPDTVGVSVNGVTKYLPGYYLAAGLAGMGAGFPVQQGFTNIGVAGIEDLRNSNFYFSKTDLNTMAGAGTMLFVQDTQGGIPYCRHELTTDMTTLNYRELLMVKELDFLSYFYDDKLKAFIGSWNITPSSLNTLRQTITAGSELLKSQSLPKIGAVLLGYNIKTLAQDTINTDHVKATVSVAIGTPLNYVDLNLEV